MWSCSAAVQLFANLHVTSTEAGSDLAVVFGVLFWFRDSKRRSSNGCDETGSPAADLDGHEFTVHVLVLIHTAAAAISCKVRYIKGITPNGADSAISYMDVCKYIRVHRLIYTKSRFPRCSRLEKQLLAAICCAAPCV